MAEKLNREAIKHRMAARLAAVQSLYAAHLCDNNPIGRAAFTDEEGRQVSTDTILRDTLIKVANSERNKYDALIDANLDRRSPQALELLLRLILRCGCGELLHEQDTPKAVVISAYVDIAKEFFDGKEPALVNAVLDKIATSLE